MKRLLLLVVPFLLLGCPKQKDVPVGPAAPLGASPTAASGTANTKQADLDRAAAERLGKIAADSDAAAKAVDEDRKSDAQGALGVQQAHLLGIVRDAAEVTRLAEAEKHRAEGRADQAEATLAELRTEASTLAQKLETLTRERDEARKRADELQKEFERQAEENGKRQAAAIAEALDRAAKAEKARKEGALLDQVKKLNWIGVVFSIGAVVVLGAGWFAGSFVGLRKAAPVSALLAGAGAWAFAAAQVIGHPYFLPIMGGATLVGLGVLGVWVKRHLDKGDLDAALRAKAEKVAGLYKQVSPVLDEAYEMGTETLEEFAEKIGKKGKATIQDVLDSKVFARLSGKMNRDEKQLVHELRAEQPTP